MLVSIESDGGVTKVSVVSRRTYDVFDANDLSAKQYGLVLDFMVLSP